MDETWVGGLGEREEVTMTIVVVIVAGDGDDGVVVKWEEAKRVEKDWGELGRKGGGRKEREMARTSANLKKNLPMKKSTKSVQASVEGLGEKDMKKLGVVSLHLQKNGKACVREPACL